MSDRQTAAERDTMATRRPRLLGLAGLALLSVGFFGLTDAQTPFGHILAGLFIMSGAVIAKHVTDSVMRRDDD